MASNAAGSKDTIRDLNPHDVLLGRGTLGFVRRIYSVKTRRDSREFYARDRMNIFVVILSFTRLTVSSQPLF